MPLADIIARTAARKAAGANQTYPEHAGKAVTVARRAPPAGAVSLPVLAPCVQGGGDEDIIERCAGCAAGSKHVRECAVHGTCTWEPVNPAVMDCARCRREGLGYETA